MASLNAVMPCIQLTVFYFHMVCVNFLPYITMGEHILWFYARFVFDESVHFVRLPVELHVLTS